MKKYYLLNSLLALAALVSFSCKEDFNLKGPFKDRYILNCILRADTTTQIAFISKNFGVDEFFNDSYSADAELRNTDIRVWHKDSVLVFKPADLNISQNSNGMIFTKDSFTPTAGEPIEIEAELSNGRKLKAVSKLPKKIRMNYDYSDGIIPAAAKGNIMICWYESDMDVYYVPRFSILYQQKINGQDVPLKKYIPLFYMNKDGKEIPVFSKPAKTPVISCDMITIDRAMREISEGDIDKENYTINEVLVEMLILDKNLGTYYSASNLLEEGFTIKVDQADYTNIEGGYGIFGSYIKQVFQILISTNYIRSFGYKANIKVENNIR